MVLTRDKATAEHWSKVYPGLSDPPANLRGAITARATAHVTRLSMVYALLDLEQRVRIEHLEAALAVLTKAKARRLRFFAVTKVGLREPQRRLRLR